MRKRLLVATLAIATGGFVAGPLAGSASACPNTLEAFLVLDCPPPGPCPPPTQAQAAVDIDGYTITVCF